MSLIPSGPHHRRMATHYELLGVEPDAPLPAIKTAYRTAARAAHPDAGGDETRMRRLNEAWRVLSDAGRRAAYDRELAFARPPKRPASEAPVLDFGRYAGWRLDAVAAADEDYLAWLARTPAGRPLQGAISRILAERRQALDALAPKPAAPRPAWAR
jgi:curved DNA-binding protein CbpA